MLDDTIQDTTQEIQIIPNIENDIPIPKPARNVGNLDLTSNEEIQYRANTIKELSDIMGEEIEPDADNQADAEELAIEIMKDPTKKVEFGNYPNETMAYLAGLVAQTNCMLVNELSDYKLHIVNRLVQEAETAKNAKDRLQALIKLGEIDGVDAFKRRTEVTHITKSGKELEEELLKTIEELKGKVIDGEHEILDDD